MDDDVHQNGGDAVIDMGGAMGGQLVVTHDYFSLEAHDYFRKCKLDGHKNAIEASFIKMTVWCNFGIKL